MEILQQAKAIAEQIVDCRRRIHQQPEISFELPKTTALVLAELESYGYQPEIVGRSGIVCHVGQGPHTFLLRADMDALPMAESSGVPFQANNGNAHACGHDAHTAMLLGAAKILKTHEASLKGCVKLMFQPAEEILAGALDMVEHGLLKSPDVDAALAIHIMVGIEHAKSGVIYHKSGALTYSGDAFAINVTGRDAHGSTPHLGIDAILVAAQIVTQLQSIVAKEVAPSDKAVVLVGKIQGGTAVNTVAGEASLAVSTRARKHETRAYLHRRVREIAQGVAQTYGAEVVVEHLYGMPPLINDIKLDAELTGYCKALLGEQGVDEMPTFNGTEDFSVIAEHVPAVLFTLGVGAITEGYSYGIHHPSMHINESALAIGAAVYAECATRWLAAKTTQ